MTITDEMCGLVVRTAKSMGQGAERRRYMADTITSLSLGQRAAQTLLGWDVIPSARRCMNTLRNYLLAMRFRNGAATGRAPLAAFVGGHPRSGSRSVPNRWDLQDDAFVLPAFGGGGASAIDGTQGICQ